MPGRGVVEGMAEGGQPAQRRAVVLPALWRAGDYGAYHAVTVDLSTAGIRLRSATLPRAEQALTCDIRGVGTMEARVAWVGACDFVIGVTGRAPSPGEVARRLVDLARRQAQHAEPVRVDRRIVPRRTAVHVTLADGTGVPALILNLSASGVALRLDAPPARAVAVGQTVRVGRREAVVARLIPDGIGAAFLEPFDAGAVNEGTVL